jgi:hypothetical protein
MYRILHGNAAGKRNFGQLPHPAMPDRLLDLR